MRYEEGLYKGQVVHAQFVLGGYIGGYGQSGVSQDFTFNEAISFMIKWEDQQEIDYYWKKLTKEGKELQCGWCQDLFDGY